MRWLKVFLVSLFIGFYFLSITPIHFYAHDFDISHSTPSKSADDCSYINLLQTGQGNYLDSGTYVLSEDIPLAINDHLIQTSLVLRFDNNFLLNFNLRGPPAIA